jgi:hypothetical protein
MVYHVLNRGNGRMRLFRKPGDYAAFEEVLAEGRRTHCVWDGSIAPKTGNGAGGGDGCTAARNCP